MPQFQIKGPTLRRWHSRIAVAVDRPFFTSLAGPSAQPSQDPDAGDVVWLVPELRDGQLVRGHWEVLTLDVVSIRPCSRANASLSVITESGSKAQVLMVGSNAFFSRRVIGSKALSG